MYIIERDRDIIAQQMIFVFARNKGEKITAVQVADGGRVIAPGEDRQNISITDVERVADAAYEAGLKVGIEVGNRHGRDQAREIQSAARKAEIEAAAPTE